MKKTHIYLGDGKSFTLFCTFHVQNEDYINVVKRFARDKSWATLIVESEDTVPKELFVGIDYAAESPPQHNPV